jgi:hypothetical protein
MMRSERLASFRLPACPGRISVSCRSPEPEASLLQQPPRPCCAKLSTFETRCRSPLRQLGIPSHPAKDQANALFNANPSHPHRLKPRQSHPKAVYKGCTPDAHRMYKGKTPVHPLCIRCAPLVHNVRCRGTGLAEGDEALLCLETYWRNSRWHLPLPHGVFDPARD